MRSHLLVRTAVLALLSLPLMASADVSYRYTGNLFNEVHAHVEWEGWPPEQIAAESAALEDKLRQDQVTINFTAPVYLPAGWSTFSSTAPYTGGMATALQALADSGYSHPGITWEVTTSIFSGAGTIALDGNSPDDLNFASRIAVSVHVDSNHQIDAWELRMAPGYLLTDFGWRQALTSSSASGDSVLFENAYRHYSEHQDAANASAGAWAVSGAPVSAVPAPATTTMLLAGLTSLAALRRRQRRT